MRHDMYKVIVERPRHGRYLRLERRVDELLDSPRCEGLRARHLQRKSLNENLRPLERYLATQVGRPWDKVYAEICAGIDRRNTVQQHIHQHLEDFVAVRVIEIGGQLHSATGRWRDPSPLAQWHAARFYVCPRTRLLRANVFRERVRREWRQSRHDQRHVLPPDRRVLDATRQLHRVDGFWYEVDVANVAEARAMQSRPFDVLRRKTPDQCPEWNDHKGVASNFNLLGNQALYAWRKRQLGAAELRRYGLANDNI
jgi:hypothetical protein